MKNDICCIMSDKEPLTCIDMSPVQMTNCDLGDMKLGRLTVRRPALNMRDMRFVFVNSAAYTTVKQNPTPNLQRINK